jgi:cytochrome P450
MIDERAANLADAPNDLLTRMIAAQDPDGGEALSAQEVRNELITIFEAGHETTAVALTFTFYLLSQHPVEEARLHAELDAVLGDRAATAEDVARLTYTRQVIEEAMRLYPPAPAVTGRVARADDVICGEPVRAGDQISILIWVLHRHRTLWEQPETFDPDRFSAQRSEGRPRFAYLPFGGGPHICIGAVMAMTEAVLILATLAQKFRLRLAQDEVRLKQQITLSPVGGLKMRLEARG